MPENIVYYRTPDGKPPNGGVAPRVQILASTIHPGPIPCFQYSAPSPPPPYYHVYATSPYAHNYASETPTTPPSPPPPSPPPPPHSLPSSAPPLPGSKSTLRPEARVKAASEPKRKPNPEADANRSLPTLPTLLLPTMTTIHLINKSTNPQPQDATFQPSTRFRFSFHQAPTNISVLELIDLIRRADDPEREKGIMEIFEVGNGRWAAGRRFSRQDASRNCTLRQVGWGADRGKAKGRKPVWLVFAV
jgi:hypothetical protein